MKKIVIIPNMSKDRAAFVTAEAVSVLKSVGITSYIEKKYSESLKVENAVFYTDFPTDAELLIVVGGDGSVLDASPYAVKNNIPLIAINLGKVGYLSEIDPSDLSVLKKLATNEYDIKEKMLLSVKRITDGGEEEISKLALNDVVVSQHTELGVAKIKIGDSIGNTVRYRADGVLFSTPQGSTSYSLSAGGPVVAHDVDTIIMTPICPHSFFNRSVLFNSNEEISVKNCGKVPLSVSVDGRCLATLAEGDMAQVKKADKKIKILTFSKNSMFTNLFKKMGVLEELN